MSEWRDVNKDSWSFTRKVIVGSGGGIGKYRISYALNVANQGILNGKISAEMRLINPHRTGAGLICRADERWSFLMFYTAPAKPGDDYTIARFGVIKEGVFTPLAALPTPIRLTDEYASFTLEFYSGHVRGEISTNANKYEISATCPNIPFPGMTGLVKLYGAEVAIKNVFIEKTEMPFSIPTNRPIQAFDFDILLCHSGADKDVILKIAEELREAKIRYWLDSEQIAFGDGITAKIEDGLKRSRYIVPCVSSNLGRSGWTRAEYGAILNAELSGEKQRLVIPLRIDQAESAEVPLLLRDKKRVTYSNKVEFAEFLTFLRRS